MKVTSFKPDFCFVVVHDPAMKLVFKAKDRPSKVIKTPTGYYLYFEQYPFNIPQQHRLASLYNGEMAIRRIIKEGSVTDDGFIYEEVKLPKKPEFEDDHRKENPGLHMLYVKWACKHLVIIDGCIERMNSESNANMDGPVSALRKERAKLIKCNAAYHDAHEIMNEMCRGKGKKLLDSEGYQKEDDEYSLKDSLE